MTTCDVKGYTKTFKGKMVKVKGYSRRVGIRGVHSAPVKKSKSPGDEFKEKVAEKVTQEVFNITPEMPKGKENTFNVHQMARKHHEDKGVMRKQSIPIKPLKKVEKVKKTKSRLERLSAELGILSGRRRK